MRNWIYFLSVVILGLITVQPLEAQIFRKKKAKADVKVKKTGNDKYAEKIKNADVYEGLFTLYRDPDKGNVYIEISADQLNKEYIHFSYIENGVSDAGFFRGNCCLVYISFLP